jgi:hypothetical protein
MKATRPHIFQTMKLPKFLLAEKSSEKSDRTFVVHCEHPRFIVEFLAGGGEGDFLLFDISSDPAKLVEAKHQARVFFDGPLA